MVVRNLHAIFGTFFFLVACSGKESGQFAPPEFLKAEVEVTGASATFTCQLSSDRVEECGVLLDEKVIAGTMDGNAFTAMADGLEIGKEHIWSAFAKAGESEIRSEEKTFEVPDGAIPIPDPAFKAYLAERYDINHDGEISLKEAETIWRIDFCSNALGVKSIEGIAYMPNLEEIHCTGDWLDSFDLGAYSFYYRSRHYRWDTCIGPIGTLESLDVSRNSKLRVLNVSNNSALGDLQGSLDLSQNPALEEVNLNMTYLVMPDVSHLEGQLISLLFSHLRGTFPDVTRMPLLRKLEISFEQTGRKTAVDISQCPLLEELLISGSGTSLSDLHLNHMLRRLDITCCDFAEMDISMLPLLEEFNASMNFFRSLDVSANPALRKLYLSPMNDDKLETLYIAPGQVIPGVTENRSELYIPGYTQIIEKSVE